MTTLRTNTDSLKKSGEDLVPIELTHTLRQSVRIRVTL